jgi:hypothetical protein
MLRESRERHLAAASAENIIWTSFQDLGKRESYEIVSLMIKTFHIYFIVRGRYPER